MHKAPDGSRIDVLIDGDNLSGSHADALFRQIAALGTTSVRRLYGDFQNGRMKDWLPAVEKHGIVTIHVQPTGGKNGTDMALAMDAMDLLHTYRPDIFCIVTSDRDYTRLILRLREAGCMVHGFGEAKAPASLSNACNQFHHLKSVSVPTPQTSAAKPPATASKAIPNPTKSPAEVKKQVAAPEQKGAKTATAKPATAPQAPRQAAIARPAIDKTLADNAAEWITLSALATALRAQDAGYLKKTGYASLKKLLMALSDIYEQGVAADGKTAQVRRRKPNAKAAEKRATETSTVKKPHLAWPWIEAALPVDLDAWITLSALEQALHISHPDYLKNTGFASLKAILRALTDHFELGLAEDGETVQVRRRRP